jgi:hypothetical protein
MQVDSKFILRPKDKISLTAKYMHLRPLQYENAALSHKVIDLEIIFFLICKVK